MIYLKKILYTYTCMYFVYSYLNTPHILVLVYVYNNKILYMKLNINITQKLCKLVLGLLNKFTSF